MTEKEANKKLLEYPNWICPLRGEICNKECYCYNPAVKLELGKDDWYIEPGYCGLFLPLLYYLKQFMP